MQTFMIATLTALATAQPTYYNMQHQTFGIGSWDMSLLNYFVVPGIMAGLAVFLVIMLIFLFVMCQLMSVQAPSYFIDKPIDYGKSEEVE